MVVTAGVALLTAAGAAGQTFFGEVAVDVVAVDVTVTAASGEPMRGLQAEDFVVKVDGSPVSAQLVWSPAAAPAARSAVAASGVTVVVLIDRTFSSQRFRVQALEWLEPFLRAQIDAGGPVLVAAADPLVTVVHRVDAEPEALWRVLATERTVAGSGGAFSQEREYLLRTIERVDPAGPGGAAEVDSVLAEVRAYGERTAQMAAVHLEALARFVDGMSGLAGRAVVVYVAERLPVRPTEVLEMAVEQRLAGLPDAPPIGSARLRARRPEVDRALDLLERAAAAAGLPLLLVDPAATRSLAGLTASQRGSATRWEGAAADSGAALEVASSLAAATGGRILAANEGLPQQLEQVRDALAAAYRLTFTPPHETDDAVHRVEVRVARPGARVAHREHYRLRTPREKVTTAALAALQVGAGEDRFRLQVETGAARAAGEGVLQVPLLLRVPLDAVALIPQGREHRGELLVAVASGDGEGRLEGLHDQPLPLVIPNDELLTALGQDAGFAVHLGLRPGPHVLGIAVLDQVTGSVGSVRARVVVAAEAP